MRTSSLSPSEEASSDGSTVSEPDYSRASLPDGSLARLLEDAGLVVGVADPEGRLLFVNRNGADICGLTADEMVGREFVDFVADEYRNALSEEHRARMEGRLDAVPLDLPLIDREGREHTVAAGAARILGEDGSPVGVGLAGFDVTTSRLLERHRALQAREFELVFRLSGDLYFRLDPELYAREFHAAEPHSLAVSPEMFEIRPLSELVPPAVGEVLGRGVERAHESGSMCIEEYELITDGVPTVWEARFLPLPKGDTAVVCRDVTERTSAESALRESEQRVRSILEKAPFGMFLYRLMTDGRLVLIGANDAADKILGLDRTRLIGLTVEEAFPGSVEDGWARRFKLLAADGGSWSTELVYADRRVKGVYQVDAFQISQDQIAVIFTDTTERRAIENEERRYKARLSAMAAELASAEDRERRLLAEELHDRVSQALAVCRMRLEAAVDDHGALDRSEYETAVEMLEDAIRQTRSVTTALYPPVLHELGLGPALRWLCEDVGRTHALGCTVTLTEANLGITEDAQAVLFRATRELLLNVVKHAHTNRAWVSLDSFPNSVVLTVSDQGAGYSTTRMSEGSSGSGFGLFSIRERLLHFGGGMEVETAPGDGTRVTISVPVGLL